jgi:hypothetical protein
MNDKLIHRKTSTYTGQHKHRINVHINIYASSRIRIYDPGIQASQDSSCLRPLRYCDRLCVTWLNKIGRSIVRMKGRFFLCQKCCISSRGHTEKINFTLWRKMQHFILEAGNRIALYSLN